VLKDEIKRLKELVARQTGKKRDIQDTTSTSD
jgi:hypothetical protein